MRRIIFIVLLFSLSTITLAKPVALTGVLIEPSLKQTIVTFIMTQKTFGRVKYMPKPDRVMIEFKNTEQHFDNQPLHFAKSNVKTVQVKQINAQTLQFIFNLRGPCHAAARFLPAVEHGARLRLEMTAITLPPKAILATRKTLENTTKKPISELPPAVQKVAEKLIAKPSLITIVIDAGHGGKDPGAKGARGTLEKNIVLAIAKKLAKEINEQPHMRAILTRRQDNYLSLYERLKLTRKGSADVFVAIHADAHYNNSAAGSSVYILSHHGASTVAAKWLAQRENHEELDDVSLSSLQDQSSMLRSVLIDLAQTKTAQESIKLGTTVLDALDDVSTLHYKQVEHAPFLVLKSPDIPSILIETGFLSNSREEQRLASVAYQAKIARAIRVGIVEYVKKAGMT